MQLQPSDMKLVLMPRLRLLIKLDLEGLYEFNAPQMRELIRPHAEEYRRVVLRDQLPEDMDVKSALKVYSNFNCSEQLQHGVIILCPARARLALRIASVQTPFSFVSLFKPTVEVPKGYVGATVSERKQCKKVDGLAGRRKRLVLKERQDDEKVIHTKALLLAETPPPAAEPGPSPRDKAAALIVPEAVRLTTRTTISR